jgi:TatD DNase family protein
MFFDTHCHLTLFKDIPSILAKAKEKGVTHIFAVAMYYKDNWDVLELAKEYSEIIPGLGIHPIEVPNLTNVEEKLETIDQLLLANRIRIVGEIGLDRYFVKDKQMWNKQEEILKHFLEFASQNELVVNLHGKDAEGTLFQILSQYDLRAVQVHWFAGSPELIKEGIKRGYYFSVTPAVYYSDKMRRVVELVPLDHLLSESDGPVRYKGQQPFNGEPALMEDVVREIAQIKQADSQEVEQILYNNAQNLVSS